MKTEKTIRQIMTWYKCSRPEALVAPDKVCDYLPIEQPPLSEAEIEYGKKVAARLGLEFAGSLKT